MLRKLNMVLCTSLHVPSGADESEFDRVYSDLVKPLVLALDRYPKVNMVFHYSGVLLYWIERRHPEFFMLLGELISQRRAEFLGGGFYNPMLSVIPPVDRIGQIEMLTTYLRKHFGKRPLGCWLPPMSWEQNLVGSLNSSGMNYTFLDDCIFSRAGLSPCSAELFSPCITEDQGKLITVFPVSGTVGKKLLTEDPESYLASLTGRCEEENPNHVIAVLIGGGDAGDITADYDKLFSALSGMDDLLDFTLPGRFFRNLHGLKKVYFPNQDSNGEFLNPRQFLAEHPEAGGIYAKTVYVHSLINTQLRGDKARKRTAMEEMWKAQDSGLYRMGCEERPGLIHSSIRKAAYSSLLESEKITREKSKFSPSLSVFDFDLDGDGEYIFNDDKVNFFIKNRGAALFELDYLPGAWNYLDTMRVSGDKEKRCSFVDWFTPIETQIENIGLKGIEWGRFLGGEEFELLEADRVRRKAVFRLPPKENFPWADIEVVKTWQLKKNIINLDYLLKNTGKNIMELNFCPQIDLSFPGDDENLLRIFSVRDGAKESILFKNDHVIKNAKTLEFQDIYNEVLLTLDAGLNCNLRIIHIHSELNKGYQSTCLMPLFPIYLGEGKSWKLSFTLKFSS